jgi:aminoglycoside phosphotransferase family enzyme/predicted kinase
MELNALIEALSQPAAYPHPVADVEVHQTHISIVWLAGPYAYKVKKPVEMGFLDFSTLDKRRHFCEEEVRLNRRLAPTVYLGVVPVTRNAAGVRLEGEGEVIEWAVKMERLPDHATLEQRLQRGEVTSALVISLARKIAGFHDHAESGPHIAAFGRFDVVAGNARENFDQSVSQVGSTISQAVFDRLRALTDETLIRHRSLIEARAERGLPRDTHGDLHLDHVYLFPDREPPDDLVIIDCIEFNERFRFADPVADTSFLAMDLLFHGRGDLAEVFSQSYLEAAGDQEGRALLPFYTAYRAAVRGKVEGFELLEKEVPAGERAAALARARAHWLLALGQLEEPGRKPCLVLVGGLPGTGKSTLARGLAAQGNLSLIRSDVVRKDLAGLSEETPASSRFGEGIYAPAWTARAYGECLHRADALLFEGKRVVVDATFAEEEKRRAFLDAAARLCVPAILFLCRAEPQTVRLRLEHRHCDVSDADWSVYLEAAERWEEPAPGTRLAVQEVTTNAPPEQTIAAASKSLRDTGV